MRQPSGGFELIQWLVANRRFDYTRKAAEALNSGLFARADLLACIEQGRVIKRERDDMRTATDGLKYVIRGRFVSGAPMYVMGKIVKRDDGPLFLVCTAHEWR